MTFSRTAGMRRGRYEATETIGEWTAAYDESGQKFWYDELTHETTYDPSAGRRHPQPHHQAMSHTAFFSRGGSTSGGGHIPPPQMLPQDGGEDYPMAPARAYPYAAPEEAASGYVTSSGHMVSARAPSYAELPSRSFSPLHHHHHQRQHSHQHHHQQHHQQHYQQQHHHHHQHGRQGYGAAAAAGTSSLLNGYRWEECFKMDGKKFWRHKETGIIIHKDPYR